MYHVYLTDGVTNLKGFTSEERPFPGGSRTVYSITHANGTVIELDQTAGRWYVRLCDDRDEVPQEIAKSVGSISFKERIPRWPLREMGIYVREGARAEVTSDNASQTLIHITGTTLKNIRELYHQIRAGSIRPEESCEGEQSGKSRTELEAELALHENLNARLLEVSERVLRRCERFESVFRGLLHVLTHDRILGPSWWPWCNTKLVAASVAELIKRLEEPPADDSVA